MTLAQSSFAIAPIDLAILIAYLAGIVAIGLFASRRQGSTSAEYFLAGRSLRWPVIGLALFATNISTVHLVGLAADGYRIGLVVGNFEWMATFFLILLGLVFAPFYFRNRIATLPDYLELRYSAGSRMVLAFMAVVGALFIHIGLSLFAGATILRQFFGINIYFSIVSISALTALYTVFGGLKAVVVTESIQTFLLLLGAIAVTVCGMNALSDKGIESYASFRQSVELQESIDRSKAGDSLTVIGEAMRSAVWESESGDHEFIGEVKNAVDQLRHAGFLPAAIGRLDSTNLVAEANLLKVLAKIEVGDGGELEQADVNQIAAEGTRAANLSDAGDELRRLATTLKEDARQHKATALSGAKPIRLSMIRKEGPFPWYAMLLGYPVLAIWYWCADQTIVQRVLGARTQRDAQLGPLCAGFIKILPLFLMVFPGVMAYVLFRERIGDDANRALAVLIDELIPTGLKGLIAAGLLAAVMSTVAGALNSTATLVSIDIFKKVYPNSSDRALIRVGRLTACVVMLVAMIWSTQGGHFQSVFEAGNMMLACLAPPISVVFIWGVLWPRGTKQASLITLLLGFLLGFINFAIDYPLPIFGDKKIVTDVWGIPFMMQAWWLFVICSTIYVVVSLATPRPDPKQIENLCWSNPLAAFDPRGISHITDPRVLAAVLFSTMMGLYWVFG